MDSIITNENERMNAMKMSFYENAGTQDDREDIRQEEVSCNQLLKNLLKTNLRLLKMNDITFLMF